MKIHWRKKTFIISGIATIIYSIIVAALIYYFASNAIVSNLTEALTEIAVQGAKTVENELKGSLEVIETIAAGDTITNPEISIKEKIESLKKEVTRKGFARMSIADQYGNSITTDGKEIYIGDRGYFKLAIMGQKNISDPVISRIDNNLIVTYAVPIMNNGRIIGVLYSTRDVEILSKITDSIRMGEHGKSYIADSKGTIIAHEDRKLVRERLNPIKEWKEKSYDKSVFDFFNTLLSGTKGGGQYELNGSTNYAGYSRIKGTDWSFVISAPKNQIFKSIDQIYYSVIFLLLSALFVFSGAQLYIKYLRKSLESEKAFSNIAVETANLIILSIDSNGNINDFNKYAESKLGYSKSDIVGKIRLVDVVCKDYEDNYIKLIESTDKEQNLSSYELPLISKSQEIIYILWNIKILPKHNGDIIEMIGVDISERAEIEKKLVESHEELTALYEELYASEETLRQQYEELLSNQKKIHQLAYYDSLTGLPNRIYLENIFNSNILGKDIPSALMFIDLDNFKFVNDTFGHNVGDNLLLQAGERIKEVLGEGYWASRLGGDEFMILIQGFSEIKEVELCAEKLLKVIESSFCIENTPISISSSIGIAIYPEHGTSFDDLMKSADIAMYAAKESGKRKYEFFNQEMNDAIVKKMTFENSMRKALANNEFLLHYQPQCEISSGKIRGFEALLRWESSEHGFVPPKEFIGIAETSGLILPLGKWVLNEACKFIKGIRDMGFSQLNISVNISVMQLMQDDFAKMVMEILEEIGLEPSCLELEITETILMEFIDHNMAKIKELNDLGVKISLDDFGTGYSSLTYLRELPINILKIDKSFIDNIASTNDKSNITGYIISLAHEMGLKVVAEGVETKKQLDYLSYYNCDIVQGYFISKPVPKDKALEFLFKDM